MYISKLKYRVFYVSILTIVLLSDLMLFSYKRIDASVVQKQYNCFETSDLFGDVYLKIKDMSNTDEWESLKSDILQIQKEKEELLNQRAFEQKTVEPEIPKNLMKISVSAYTMGKWTASGTRVRLGVIAASHDLLRQWDYGSTVILYTKDRQGKFVKYGEYVLEDKMHSRWKKTCDIYMKNDGEAFEFGRRTMWVEVK